MIPPIHLILTLILSYFAYPYIGLTNAILLFFGGWIFDVDHYLYCIFKHKNFSLKECWKFHHPFAKERDVLHVFHVIEFYVLILIVGLFIKPILYLFYGLLYHISFDLMKLAYLKIKKEPRAINCRAFSLIMWLRRHSNSG